MSGFEVRPIDGLPEVLPGTDLAALILDACPWLADGDIVVVSSKIVSKAEGLLRAAVDREAAIDADSVREVARRGPTRIVVTRQGLVMAAAGVDASNVESGHVLSLPPDPDDSARRLRAALHSALGPSARVGVIITDTMGRAWRDGLVDVAIGAAGLAVVDDFRGRVDPYGNELAMTVTALADEIAAAADLVKGKLSRVPVAVVRGLGHLVQAADGPGAVVLVRPIAQDMFVLGAAEAAALGVRAAIGHLTTAQSGAGHALERVGRAALTADEVRALAEAAIASYIARHATSGPAGSPADTHGPASSP